MAKNFCMSKWRHEGAKKSSLKDPVGQLWTNWDPNWKGPLYWRPAWKRNKYPWVPNLTNLWFETKPNHKVKTKKAKIVHHLFSFVCMIFMEDFSMGNQRLHFTLGLINTSLDPWPYDSGYGGCGPAVHFIVTFPVFLILSAVDSNKLFKHEQSNNDPILGTSSRRGSRPFLSPDERPDIERDGSGSSLGGRSTRSGRRDSLSPDSANEDGTFFTSLFNGTFFRQLTEPLL